MATILQLSDTHLVAKRGGPVYGKDPDAQLDAALDACADQAGTVDLVLVSGDLSDDGSRESYRRLAARLGPIGAPVLAFGGNHDDPVLLARHFDTAATTRLGRWSIVVMDTARPPQTHGTVDIATATTLLATAVEPGDPILLAMHHPPISPSTRHAFSLDGAGDLIDLVAATPQVRAIVSGHLHEPFEMSLPNGAPVLGAPSTLTGAVHHGDTYDPGPGAVTGARIVTLNDDGTVTSEVRVSRA